MEKLSNMAQMFLRWFHIETVQMAPFHKELWFPWQLKLIFENLSLQNHLQDLSDICKKSLGYMYLLSRLIK